MNKLANYDNDSGIGDIAGKVIESAVNSVITSANDTVKNILNLDNNKNKNDNTKTALRDFAIVYLLAYTGLRISECLNIQFRNLNLAEQELTVTGKGNKQRTVYLNDNVCAVLKDYLDNNRTYKNYGDFIRSQYVFISNRSNKLTTSRINQIFDKYNDKIHPHSLRHWFCSNAYESGMLLHEIANQAGHANIQITMRYTNPTKQQLKNKMNNLL